MPALHSHLQAAASMFSASRTSFRVAQVRSGTRTSFVPSGRCHYSKSAIAMANKTIPVRPRKDPPRWKSERQEPLSADRLFFYKDLANLLRRGSRPPFRPLAFRPDGFVRLEQLLDHIRNAEVTVEYVINLMETSNPREFELKVEPEIANHEKVNTLWIRALDGHKIEGVNSRTQRIGLLDGIKSAYYKSTLKQWEVIQEYGIVQATSLRYIKLFKEPTLSEKNLKQLTPQPKTTVIIEVDVEAAMAEGIIFYQTPSREVLTEGDSEEKHIPVHHIKSVTAYDMSKEDI